MGPGRIGSDFGPIWSSLGFCFCLCLSFVTRKRCRNSIKKLRVQNDSYAPRLSVTHIRTFPASLFAISDADALPMTIFISLSISEIRFRDYPTTPSLSPEYVPGDAHFQFRRLRHPPRIDDRCGALCPTFLGYFWLCLAALSDVSAIPELSLCLTPRTLGYHRTVTRLV